MNAEDERISLLTAYVVGLEGVLARLDRTAAQKLFLEASDFAAGVVRTATDAILSGALPAAQRVQSQPIRKDFQDGWPSISIPSAMDLIVWRASLIDFLMKNEETIKLYFYGKPIAAQFDEHMSALYEGLGVIERHRGDVRAMRPARDDRARSAQQHMKFDFRM
ncbi:MAG TPA: hypothetical protein PKW15_01495 [Alphaproteobacteria bacterium]|nr:hypothetical protein [Rhodospirillaceae bacterium]HRJ11898.1 hypothetical protein [Alphaproteobacteria bacterium]